MQETRVILSLIYRDYICLPEERKELIEIDKEQLRREEETLREKYAINFEDRKQKIKEDNIQESDTSENNVQKNNMYMTKIKEEKWYKKIINKILIFFRIRE